MNRTIAARNIMGLGLGLLLVGGLGGCGGSRGFESETAQPGTTIGNLLAFNKLKLGPAPERVVAEQLECPAVEVLDGTASMRTYAGAEQTNQNVKNQFSMGDVVRECSHVGDQLVIKVGAEGRVLVGPAGSPGTFEAPIRIAVRREKDETVVASKLYTTSVSMAPGTSVADFTVVSDPISVPFKTAHADADYTILVGFDQNGKSATAKPVKQRRR